MTPDEAEPAQSIEVRIDGVVCTAIPGENIVELAARHGIYIPTLCWFRGMETCLGTCRVCTIKWKRHYVAACALAAEAGMDLTVDTPELRDIRKGLVELLFVEGNHFCPSCEKSGDCQLQALGYRLGMTAPRFHYRFNPRAVDFRAKRILFEQNRCVFCKRCVHRFTDQLGQRVFAFHDRGGRLGLEMDIERADGLSDEKLTELIELCPVGALLKKGKGFDRPYGTRRYDREPIGIGVENAGVRCELEQEVRDDG